MASFRLYWKKRQLEVIHDVSGDFPEMYGTFEPTKLPRTFLELFNFFVDEEKKREEPPFAQELLDDDNWWLVDEQGGRWAIFIPGVYLDDGMVIWRWRTDEKPKW